MPDTLEKRVEDLEQILAHLPEDLDARFAGVDVKLAELREVLALHSTRFTKLEARLNEVERRIGDLDRKFGDLDRKFGDLDRKFGDLDGKFDGLDGKFNGLDRKMDGLTGQIARELSASEARILAAVRERGS
jgi:chromosome segregation ATPase